MKNNNSKIGINILCKTAKEQYLFDKEKYVLDDWKDDFHNSFVTNDVVIEIINNYCVNFAFLNVQSSECFNKDGTVTNSIIFEIVTVVCGKLTNKKQLKKELTEYIQSEFNKLFNA